MNRRRKLLVIAAVAVPVLAYAVWAGYVRFAGPAVRINTQVGRTEAQVRGSYGEPHQDWPGYQPLALYVPPSLPPRMILFRTGKELEIRLSWMRMSSRRSPATWPKSWMARLPR